MTDILLAFSTFALALFTAGLAFFTARMANATFKLVSESREASFRQICVQMWLEFQKRFDSAEMLRARKTLAQQIKTKDSSRISETVLNFFEDLGIAYTKGYVEKELAEDSFSFYVCRWWEASKSYVDQERRRHKEDATLFANFENLAKRTRLPNEIIDDRALHLFLDDESDLIVG
jgi:uncharacterized protein DUF4760